MSTRYTKADLIGLQKKRDFLVGIDSDGCVFDTMETKQCHHFHPLIIRFWNLEKIESQVVEAAEFFSMYSQWRGLNRFENLLETFKALPDMPGVRESGVELPATEALQAYIDSGVPLGHPTLEDLVRLTGDDELRRVLDWSLALNEDIDLRMDAIAPFPSVASCLEYIQATADLLVVSQTPEVTLIKEWELHGIAGYVRLIAGPELGSKVEHLEMARGDRWPSERILMVGDAPGDRRAAQAVGACFFPILPGEEEASWQRLRDEAYDRFTAGNWDADYQKALIDEFELRLPEKFPWLS